MKKIIVLLLLVAAMILTFGCDGKNDDGESANNVDSASAQTTAASVENGDNVVDFNDINGGSQNNGGGTNQESTSADNEWTNTY